MFAAPPLATADCVAFELPLLTTPVAIGCWLAETATDPDAAGACVAEAAGAAALLDWAGATVDVIAASIYINFN